MTLPTKTIPQLVEAMIATWAGKTGTTTSFSDGDVLLALWQSVAAQMDFLQAQIQLVLNLTRAQTSSGEDLDTWMGQFRFTRLVATAATGQVTFSRYSPGPTQVLIPVGTIVQTQGGGLQYQVVADENEASYSEEQQAYVLPAGYTSITGTVQALVAGAASNISGGAITQLATSVPGIDVVTNGAPIANGIGAESDDDYRDRFILYLSTLAKATRDAILAASKGVQQGLAVTLLENQRPDGSPLLGSFTVIVDDGSGAPPTSLLDRVFEAIDRTRAFSVQPFVIAPTVISVTITIALRLDAGFDIARTNTTVQNTIASIVNSKGPGEALYVSDISGAAMLVSGVTSVRAGTTLNGSAADIIPQPFQEVRTTIGSIAVTNY